MIILSNCLVDCVDEGCLKVGENLIRRIKAASDDVTLVTYENASELSDFHWNINKFMLNPHLLKLIRQRKEQILYIPRTTRMLPMALRTFILSRFAHWGLDVLLAMRGHMGKLTQWLLKHSHANLIALSQPSQLAYQQIIGNRSKYLLAAVDTQKFLPVDQERKLALREKYGIPADKPVVLHVGHMKVGRNIGHLLSIDDDMHAVLVVSAVTNDFNDQDREMCLKLRARSNVTIIDSYIDNIEEIYQLADVYLFPVVHEGNCIDIPLSVMEAASCNLPVVTTQFGEMQQFIGREGFYEIRSFEPKRLNTLIRNVLETGVGGRESVLDYDWNLAVDKLLSGRI